jgi:protein subunit release factor A
LEKVLEGELEPIIQTCIAQEQQQQLEELASSDQSGRL